MNSNQIERGDFVEVIFTTRDRLSGIVTHVAQATGDAFHIRPVKLNGPNGWMNIQPVVYVQQYEYMKLIRSALASESDLKSLGQDSSDCI